MAKRRRRRRGRARFSSRVELERAHPELKLDNPVRIDRFVRLADHYKFGSKSDYVHCQLVEAIGPCNVNHGEGHVALLEDGSKGYIGIDCVEAHAERDSRFAQLYFTEANRLGEEIDTEWSFKRLSALLATSNLQDVVKQARRRWERLEHDVLRVRNALVPALRAKLTLRAKNNDTVVLVKVLYEEKDEDPRTKQIIWVSRPQDRRWGVLRGLECLHEGALYALGKRINEAQSALSVAEASLDQPRKTMDKWSARIEDVTDGNVFTDLDRREALLDGFCNPESLKLLWLLMTDNFGQLAVVRGVLEIEARSIVTDEEIAAQRNRWAQEIREAHESWDFRPIG